MILADSWNVEIGSGVLFAVICAVLAANRGRSAVGWFFVGLILNCFGLILLLVLPDLLRDEQRARERDAELRRMREQLKKERHVADQRHGAVTTRLDAHDRALGLDTAAPPEIAPAPPPPPPPIGAAANEPMWFFAPKDQQLGPVAQSQLRELRRCGQVRGDTLVWREGLADWVRYRAWVR